MLLVFSRLATRSQLRRPLLIPQRNANRTIYALKMMSKEDDAVYDSEPERERAREERRRERRAKRAEERAKQKPEVIDIPSDDDMDTSLPGNNAGPSIVINAGELAPGASALQLTTSYSGTPSFSSSQRPLPKPIQRSSADTHGTSPH